MTSDPSSPKLLKLFTLIASLLSWQHISLWIKFNHREITRWDSSLVPEEFWEEISVVMFWVEGYAVIWEPATCTYGLRMPFLVLDPQALCSTHKCFLDPFSLLLWGLTIAKQRLAPDPLYPTHSIALTDIQQKMPADHIHDPSLTFPSQPTSPVTKAGVACTQKTNGDASLLQCQKMGKEYTHAIECISFFTSIVDIHYSFACLVLPYPENAGENKPYQWDLPKNKEWKSPWKPMG